MIYKEAKNKNKERGFTIVELLIVVAIIGVLAAISVPVFTGQLEKSREAADIANVRAAYAELMVKVADTDGNTDAITVGLNQKLSGWQTKLPITIGGVAFNGTNTDNWIGTPGNNGTCEVSYDKDKGAIFNWSAGSGGGSGQQTYTGDLMGTKGFLRGKFSIRNNDNMQDNRAFFSNQIFEVDGTKITARVYYADSAAFKDKIASYKPEPASYEQSPFYNIENDHNTTQNQGFAYYTYGDDGSINMFIYVNSNKVYRTTDEGKTWYDITP